MSSYLKQKYKKFIFPSDKTGKKYLFDNGLHRRYFGASSYQQYKDTTGLGKFVHKNHGEKRRRELYFLRHSGVKTKKEALKKEFPSDINNPSSKFLSHLFLW